MTRTNTADTLEDNSSLEDIPSLKGCFPFRMGTSSYIVPADILPNVRVLAPLVDDVELVLFESHEFSNLPDAATIAGLDQLQKEYDLTYTVHLPLDCQLGAPDQSQRQADIGKCLRTFELTEPLAPHAFILHLHGEERGQEPARDIGKWQERLLSSVRSLLDAGVPGRMLAVETLDYPFHLALPIIEECGLSVCIDIGHLLLAGRDAAAHIKENRQRCRVIHLHGVREGKDHVDIESIDNAELEAIFTAVSDVSGPECVITLEVFDEEIFRKSAKKMIDFT